MIHIDITNITNLIDIIIAQWLATVLIVVVLAGFCIGIKSGVKRALKFMLFACAVLALALLAEFIIGLVTAGDTLQIIDLAIAWGPTALFVLILFVSTLLGAKRGLRKSTILFVQAICCALICLTVYFIFLYVPEAEEALYQGVNAIMGSETALPQMLGVSGNITSFRQLAAEYLPTLVGYGDSVALIMQGSGAYLMALADLVYRIIIAAVLFVVYFVLVFLLYLVYLIFYSERKYRRKKTAQFLENRTDCSYRKNRLGGGIVGFVRGCVVGLLTLSFVGSALFIVAGGTGEGKLQERSFSDKNTDYIYSVYRSVEKYGAQGIFKVLGSVRDARNSPYYLFAADIVFSGTLDDEENGEYRTIGFRRELAAYSGFARETMTLLLKYGEEELRPILEGNAEADAMNCVVDVMCKPQFRIEFESLIDRFDSESYVINFGLSLINTMVSHLDDTSFGQSLSEDNKELVRILFQRGYLSEVIPDEREQKRLLAVTGGAPEVIPPYINLTHLLKKSDVSVVLELVFNVLAENRQKPSELAEEGTAEEGSLLATVGKILPYVERLSIFSDARKEEFNPIFGRLYCYLENRYLTEEGDGITYKQIAAENIGWTDEFRSLMRVAEHFNALSANLTSEDGEIVSMLFSVFDEANPNYAENLRLYDALSAELADSKLLGKVFSSQLIAKQLREQLSAVSENFYMPVGMVYENRYDEDGALIAHGEMYQFLYGLKLLANGENRSLFDHFFNGEAVEMTDMLGDLAAAIVRQDEQGNRLSDYLTQSKLLRSVISSILIDQSGETLYVPRSVLERQNGIPVNLIEEVQLKQLFDAMNDITELVLPFIREESGADEIGALLDSTALKDLLEQKNGIVEGTVANLTIKLLKDNSFVVIPKTYQIPDAWLSTPAQQGELQKIVAALDASRLDISQFLNGEMEDDALSDHLLNMSEETIDCLFDSEILYYTVSHFIQSENLNFGSFRVVIPKAATVVLPDDVVDSVIARDQLKIVFKHLSALDLSSDMATGALMSRLAKNRQVFEESDIISASVVSYMVDSEIRDTLHLPPELVAAGQGEALLLFSPSNPWREELPALVDALDEIFHLSEAEDFELTDERLTDEMSELLSSLNAPSECIEGETKLTVCYRSKIILSNLGEKLDEVFLDNDVVDEDIIAQAKRDGYYTQEELQALSDALEIFDLDILNVGGDELVKRITEEVSFFNRLRPEEKHKGKTTLDVLYPSVILVNLFGRELDKALEEKIDGGVLSSIKQNNLYPKAELAALVDSLNELGITELAGLTEFDFADISAFEGQSALDPTETKLHIFYRSKVVGGVMTYAVQEIIQGGDSTLSDHEKAFLEDISIYRECEMESLVSLICAQDKSLAEYGISDISVPQIRHMIYDEYGETQSYIVAATLSKNLLEKRQLVVPRSVTDGQLILPYELAALLDAYTAFDRGENIEGWQVKDDLTVPAPTARETVADSVVMRATLTDEVIALNGVNLAVRSDRITTELVYGGGAAPILCKEQILSLFTALELCTEEEDHSLGIPAFDDIVTVMAMREHIDELFACDIIRYRLSDTIVAFAGQMQMSVRTTEEEVTYLSGSTVVKQVITAEEAKYVLEEISALA